MWYINGGYWKELRRKVSLFIRGYCGKDYDEFMLEVKMRSLS